MACCVKPLAIGLVAAVGSLTAQPPGNAVPPPLHQRVVARIALEWATAPAAVRVEWGIIPPTVALDDSTAFRLLGNGADGWFVIAFEAPTSGAARLRVASTTAIPVAARALRRGTTLSAEDIDSAVVEHWGPPSTARSSTVAPGFAVRRDLRPGDRLGAPHIIPPRLVRAGETVTLFWSRGAVRIALEGEALMSAGLGDEVHVRLADRRGRARGRVTGPGEVTLLRRRF